MTKLLDEIHPGEILQEDFMQPMGITARKLAADIDVSPSRISELASARNTPSLTLAWPALRTAARNSDSADALAGSNASPTTARKRGISKAQGPALE